MNSETIIFASNNANKIKEVNELLDHPYQVISLKEAGIFEDIEEPYFTFEENAHAKAAYIHKKMNCAVFSEDSGLVVPSLKGDPGVLSARYAGLHKNDDDNNQKLLATLVPGLDRVAYYQTVICYIDPSGNTHYFKGQCHGHIAPTLIGNGGFGYDPLFIPEGYDKTFGELDPSVKKAISHRAKAMQLFIQFLKNSAQ